MDSVLTRFYQINIFLMTVVGLWPYNVTTFRRVLRVVVGLLIFSGTFQQFLTFFTLEYDLKMLATNLAPMMLTTIFLLKYLTLWIHNDEVKILLDEVQSDWHQLKNDDERRIIIEHAVVARFHIIVFIILTAPALIAFLLFPFLPNFLDMIVPLNGSRPRILPTQAEYFVNQDDYFYLIMMHMNIVVFIGAIIMLATETFTVILMHHCSALLHITGHRLTCAFADCTKQLRNTKKPPASFELVAKTVILHRKSLEFITFFINAFTTSYVVLISLGVAVLTVTLYRVSQVELSLDMLNEIVACASFTITMFGYIFFINYSVYRVSIQSYELFRTTYNTDWYNAPKQWQQLLLFMMLKCSNVESVEMISIYKPSIESFTALARMSISYFMVIRSVQ